MAKKENTTIKKENLCDGCSNSVILNTIEGKITTKHRSGTPYDWVKHTGALCKLTGVGFIDVKECSDFKESSNVLKLN